MLSLTETFKKVRFKMEANRIWAPSKKVQTALEKQGWTFETHMVNTCSSPLILRNTHYTVIKTPEGNYMDGTEEDSKRYKTALRQTAKNIYYPS